MRGRRGAAEGLEWLVPAVEWPVVLSATRGLSRAAPGDLELMRIRARVPRVLQDIGPADIPNEGGLDRDAISYSKGCYTGQEVMARVRALGRVRRVLVHVEGPGGPPATPACPVCRDRKALSSPRNTPWLWPPKWAIRSSSRPPLAAVAKA